MTVPAESLTLPVSMVNEPCTGTPLVRVPTAPVGAVALVVPARPRVVMSVLVMLTVRF